MSVNNIVRLRTISDVASDTFQTLESTQRDLYVKQLLRAAYAGKFEMLR